ncbi:DNA repair protein RecN [Clostridium grantii]|uniref:DNA repair protein RecN n=1 Tax=Clostridium grantii DSM 8605 TaxID=1121316 RepID=A0A1M5SEC0_9CLOT|nr:DNA repair protein RecN [Clostridium grantii]SHH36866.1 DNA replication and repair protein RecN [Clostridium grantii DSM 8605]
MLLQVSVKNFALIEQLTVNFEEGLNVLTGETGAGKSILIDAINFVLGDKTNKNAIRHGEDKTFVEAVFEVKNQKTIELLQSLDIDFDDVIIVSRETNKSGKSLVKVNGKTLLVSQVKELSETLLNIHGQHQNQDLLNSSRHIEFFNKYGEEFLMEVMKVYVELFEQYKNINEKIISIKKNKAENEKLLDYLQFQLKDIEKANLKENEDEELDERYKILSNAEKISAVLNESYSSLNKNSEDNYSISYILGKTIHNLKGIESNLKSISPAINLIQEAFYNIEQAIDDIRDQKDDIYYDSDELDFLNSRIFLIDAMKRKYGASIKEILEFKKSIEEKIENITFSDEKIEKLEEQKQILENKMILSCDEIYKRRLIIKDELEKSIKKELDYVGLEKAIFKVNIEHTNEFFDSGSDIIKFLISTNPGQPLQPMEKIVSGGELSRIMLSLKAVFANKDDIPTIIFDEIDTGISGRTAQSVAEKMYLISIDHQVFCVTHLPQIASMSDSHLKVFKESIDENTFTKVINLNREEKEDEIARMIGGSKITPLTLENAKEMIKLADDIKIELS